MPDFKKGLRAIAAACTPWNRRWHASTRFHSRHQSVRHKPNLPQVTLYPRFTLSICSDNPSWATIGWCNSRMAAFETPIVMPAFEASRSTCLLMEQLHPSPMRHGDSAACCWRPPAKGPMAGLLQERRVRGQFCLLARLPYLRFSAGGNDRHPICIFRRSSLSLPNFSYSSFNRSALATACSCSARYMIQPLVLDEHSRFLPGFLRFKIFLLALLGDLGPLRPLSNG